MANDVIRNENGQVLPGSVLNTTGRPKGARNKLKLIQEQIDSGAKDVIATCLELAVQGDTKAINILVDRIIPKRKYSTDDYIKANLPEYKVNTPEDIERITDELMSHAQNGLLPLPHAESLINMYKNKLDMRLKVIQHVEVMDRLSNIEATVGVKNESKEGFV